MKNIMIGSSQEYQKLNNTLLLYPGYIVKLDVQHVELRIIGAGYIIRIFFKKVGYWFSRQISDGGEKEN